ncbi:MAG: ABC transporter substrate-binding protein [Beutenbergiaceae bacterium]
MSIRRGMSKSAALAVVAGAALAIAGCTAPGTGNDDDGGSSGGGGETISEPVTPEQVAELGDITLSVWADQGEQEFMDSFIPEFESTFSNVTVDIQYKSYNDLVTTVLNAMNSDDAPDVTQGNQGWATDGALVEAGLIRPLDDVASAYGYQAAAGDAISQLLWSEDGSTFGSGTIYGMSPDNQMVGIFYNQSILDELGLEVPRTLADLEAAMMAGADAGQVPLMLGNSDKASAMQTLSILQGALTPSADTRDWITGAEGATFDVESNIEALDTMVGWVNDGYVSAGYDGTSPDDAAAAFAAGEGMFYIGGNWNAGTISDGTQFGFVAGLEDGDYASSGSFGLPWHIGANSDATLAAAAFVGLINAAETADMLAAVNRVPIHGAEASDESSIFGDLLVASDDQLGGTGALFWYDWATDTMYDTFTSGLQETLAGRQSSADLVSTVQQDWDDFQE